MSALHPTIDFLTCMCKLRIPIYQEFILLSDVLSVSTIIKRSTTPHLETLRNAASLGQSLTPRYVQSPTQRVDRVREKGEYICIEARVLTLSGEPILDAIQNGVQRGRLPIACSPYIRRKARAPDGAPWPVVGIGEVLRGTYKV